MRAAGTNLLPNRGVMSSGVSNLEKNDVLNYPKLCHFLDAFARKTKRFDHGADVWRRIVVPGVRTMALQFLARERHIDLGVHPGPNLVAAEFECGKVLHHVVDAGRAVP